MNEDACRRPAADFVADAVLAAQSGDERAFARLVARFQDKAFALAYARLGDYHLAQDAAQEAFVEAWLHRDELKTPAAFPAWLRQIVLGKCVRLVRGSKARANVSLSGLSERLAESAPGPAEHVFAGERRAAVQQALFALPEHEREAVTLFYLGGYACAEIAVLQSVSAPAVRKRLHSARGRLRTLLLADRHADLFFDDLGRQRPSRQGDAFARGVLQRRNDVRNAIPTPERNSPMIVTVCNHDETDKPVIKNLFTFYRYDLMPFLDAGAGAFVNQFGVLNGEHSRTHEEGVQGEDWWWGKPGILFAHLILADDRPAGFAMIARPPHATKGVDYRMNEFFILNKVRRQGVGTRAVIHILDRYRGKWEVGQLPNNPASVAFWPNVLDRYLGPGRYENALIGMGVDQPSLPGQVFDNSEK